MRGDAVHVFKTNARVYRMNLNFVPSVLAPEHQSGLRTALVTKTAGGKPLDEHPVRFEKNVVVEDEACPDLFAVILPAQDFLKYGSNRDAPFAAFGVVGTPAVQVHTWAVMFPARFNQADEFLVPFW